MDVIFGENLLFLQVTVGGRRGMAQRARWQWRRRPNAIAKTFYSHPSLFSLFGDEDRVRRLFFRATKRDGRKSVLVVALSLDGTTERLSSESTALRRRREDGGREEMNKK